MVEYETTKRELWSQLAAKQIILDAILCPTDRFGLGLNTYYKAKSKNRQTKIDDLTREIKSLKLQLIVIEDREASREPLELEAA